MNKPKLKVVILVYTEADFYYLIPSPHFKKLDLAKWYLNGLRGRIYRYPNPSRKGFINLTESFKKHNQKALFCLVGHLFLKECKGFPHFNESKPEHSWYNNKIGKDWYSWDKGGNFKTRPGLYLGDLVEKEKNNPLFEFGLHAFSHEALTLESRKVVDSIISSGVKAAKSVGITIKSFAAPFELTEDISDPDNIYSSLRKNKIKRVFYAGQDDSLIIKRHLSVSKPIKDNGLEKIRISNSFEGTSSKKKIVDVMKDIQKNKDKDALYCLITHDFTHKNNKNAEKILGFLKREGFS